MIIKDILKYLRDEGIDYSFIGDEYQGVEGFSSLSNYKKESFTWVKKRDNIPDALECDTIKLVFTGEDLSELFHNIIVTSESKRAFFSTIEHFFSNDEERPPIGFHTYIGPKVQLGKNVRIGHNCTLDGDISIGDNTIIWNNVSIINRVNIGSNCEIQSGTVIGHDGFGYTEDDNHIKTMVKHFGGVTIGDNVHIGMNNVIARGVIDDTIVGSGTKIADLTHIGHNNVIGSNCTIINSALFGSCITGDNAYIVYSVVRNQTSIGKNAFVGMDSNVISDVADDTTVVGNPAKTLERK